MTEIDIRPAAPVSGPLPFPAPAPVLPAPPRIVNDLTRDLGGAAAAVRSMTVRYGGDVTVAAYTAVVCTASTAAGALQEAADWCLEAPGAEIHALALARVAGHREDLWEYTVTLTVSFPDDTGHPTGQTHHGLRRAD
ncbi:hypothetical protein AB0A71_40795 [Kitasatospora aureofaciens]|uniref:hypothetical protein n=1 Tax=Kitasatospora aureofaciens TaxID=1894 RepID=UPI0033C422ED